MTEPDNPRERRLVLRLLEYWREICGERDMPAAGDVVGASMDDMWDYCFLIDLDGGSGRFTHFGKWQSEFGGADMTGRAVRELARDTLAERSTRYVDEVCKRAVPITYGGDLTQPDGRRILYRSIMLPLSDDGKTVTGILGGSNCKFAADGAEG